MPERDGRTRTTTHWGSYEVRADGDRIVSVEPVSDDASPSSIGRGMASAQRGRARILEPMVRRGWLEHGPGPARGGRGTEPFVAVSWDEAYELVAHELSRVRARYGNEAIYGGSYGWASAGRFHHAQSQIHRFLRGFGGYTDSVCSYSVGAMEVIMPRVVGGHGFSMLERSPTLGEIAEHGQLVVSFGGMAPKNASVDPGGVSRHESPALQRRCRAAGVEFVNVSPSRSDSAAELDAEWIPLRPGTDVALMLGLAHEIVIAGRHDRAFLDRCCVGFDRFAAYLLGDADGVPKTAAWAAGIADVPEATIVDLARRISTRRTVINASWSIQRIAHGEQSYWMATVLAAMSGSLGRPGGGLASGLGAAQTGVRAQRQPIASLPQGENPVSTFIPVSRLSDMLLWPGRSYAFDGGTYTYPDIRLIYWAGGNPFHHHQDLNRLVRAWQRPDTIVVHEPWWNATARFADVVFPVTTMLERNDFAAGSMDLTIGAIQKAVDPPPGVVSDYEIFSALATRLGFAAEFTEGRSADEWVRELYRRTREMLAERGVAIPPFEEFWAAGSVTTPPNDDPVPGDFRALRRDPERFALDTPSGRIEIFSETIHSFGYPDCPGHPAWLEPEEWLGSPLARRFPLHLSSNQPATRLHSQYDNGSHSRGAKIGGREPVRIHPDDAAARGIADGDVVRIFNDRGACLAGAEITTDNRPGVISLSTGAWFDPVRPGALDDLDRHGNPNVLTADYGTSRLSQGPAPGTTLVEMEPYPDAAAHPARPFEPPTVVRRPATPDPWRSEPR